MNKKIKDLEQQLADAKFIAQIDTDPAKVSLETLTQQYEQMQARMRNTKFGSQEEQKAATDNLRRMQQHIVNRNYAKYQKPDTEGSLSGMQAQRSQAIQQISVPDIDSSTFDDLSRKIDELNEKIKAKNFSVIRKYKELKV